MTKPARPQSDASKRDTPQANSREDRLKAALKANLGRRKAQARARKGSEDTEEKEQD